MLESVKLEKGFLDEKMNGVKLALKKHIKKNLNFCIILIFFYMMFIGV